MRGIDGVGDMVERFLHRRGQLAPGLGDFQAAVRAQEERLPQLLFQDADLPADRAFAHVQNLRGLLDAGMGRHDFKTT
ncbi:hypothetical protein D3C73_1373610 [compost metagenome]